jgi:zinc transport system ATP-binding protein
MKTILELKDLSYSFDSSTEILKHINFSLKENEALGILGPNGGGKTTLLKILAGIYPQFRGEYILHGKSINKSQFPYNLISYVPQTTNLNFTFPLTALEFLTIAAECENIKNVGSIINELSNLLEINSKLHYSFKTMSGGEKQRVLILKALLKRPTILLLDEPTKGLDSNGQDQLLKILKMIQEEYKTAVIIVDHNINQIIKHCDKILCLNRNMHWHDNKDLLTPEILENIYHCEFEHLLIHQNELSKGSDEHPGHIHCSSNHQGHSHIFKRKNR